MRSQPLRARILTSGGRLAAVAALAAAGCVESRGARVSQMAEPIAPTARASGPGRPQPAPPVTHAASAGPGFAFPDAETFTDIGAGTGAGSETAPGRPSLISLYGDELVGSPHNLALPFDSSANTHQVSFATEGATFDPHVDREGHWIVFASTRHRSTADIYMQSTSGTAVTQITSDPAQDIMPCFDPEATRIAFASNRSGNWDIHVQPVHGGAPLQLTNDPEAELHPTWSPDGRHIAYCKFGARSGRWEIWVSSVDNPATPTVLTYGVFPEWSPDVLASKIAFQRARERGSHYHSIWTIDVVNGESLRPTEVVSAANAALINPSWSPDGQRITFVTVVDPEQQPHPPGLSDVWSVKRDGSDPINLTNGRFANYQPVWAGDGTVYFVSNRSGVDNIWAVNTATLRGIDGGRVAGAESDAHDSGARP